MTPPPALLVSSGRRPSAGPGRQFGRPPCSTRPAASLIFIGLAATLMVSPAIVAMLSMIFAGRLETPSVQPSVPFPLAPILESGRVLLTLALATKVMRTTELE